MKSNEELINALKCCLVIHDCEKCPYEETCFACPKEIEEQLIHDIEIRINELQSMAWAWEEHRSGYNR